jgi:hypothetical protein
MRCSRVASTAFIQIFIQLELMRRPAAQPLRAPRIGHRAAGRPFKGGLAEGLAQAGAGEARQHLGAEIRQLVGMAGSSPAITVSAITVLTALQADRTRLCCSG